MHDLDDGPVSINQDPANQHPASPATTMNFATSQLRIIDAVFRASPNAIFVISPTGHCIYAGVAAARLLGTTPEEMLGRTFEDFGAAPEDCAVLAGLRVQVLATAQPANCEIELHTATGNHDFEFTLSAVQDEDGNTGAVLCLGRDVSQQKSDLAARRRAEIERGRLAAIVINSEDAILSKTLDGIITTWNPAATHIFGYTAEEAVGRPKTLLFPPDRMHEEDEILARVRRGDRVEHLETQRVRKDGRIIDVMLTISPVRDDQGQIIGASTIARDITREKAIQQELALLNTRLRRAMQETHHRVKNNLQIIAAMLDMSMMEHTDVLPMTDVQRVHQQILMLAKIHDILTENAANAHGGAERVSVKQVLLRLILMLNTAAGRYRFTHDLDDMELSAQQATSLGLVVNELTSNAIKYGRSHIHVALRVEGDVARLIVEDDGPGLPTGFDPDVQASTGLSLVETLVRHDLSGTIAFSDRDGGRGTRVTVHLPIAPRQRIFGAE